MTAHATATVLTAVTRMKSSTRRLSERLDTNRLTLEGTMGNATREVAKRIIWNGKRVRERGEDRTEEDITR
jgi:hypothetical protein